jgi:diguanylate cyclase (GGDEF)-like protein
MREFSTILVIDDEPDNFDVVETLLHGEDYQLSYVSDGETALSLLDKIQPDVILLDFMMPELSGIETCRRIKAQAAWQPIPIIIVTALNTKEDLSRCLEAGADDFISKPLDRLELKARVRSALRTYRQYQDIQALNQRLTQFNNDLERQIQQRTAQLEQLVRYDPLTQLPSRLLILQRISQALQEDLRHPFALLFLDCDQFKLINSSLGYEIGDQLLMAIAERLKSLILPHDLLARLGGDEFCFFFSTIPNIDTAKAIIHRILGSFNAPFIVGDLEVYITACCGMTIATDKQKKSEELLQEADTAMYRAKNRGKGSYQIFDYQMRNMALQRLQLEQDMQRAFQKEEFLVYYQPIIALPSRRVVGFEALSRWQHSTRGLVSPGDFIPCAEETGLIVPLGLFVLRQSCEMIQQWRSQYQSDLFVSVNLSVRQFAHPTLLDDVDQVLNTTAIAPQALKLEITESAIVENPEVAVNLIRELRSRQIQISIDDFGTGYSSLAYLSRFPVDSLKVDRSFISHVNAHPDSAIVKAVITLGHALNMSIIAEGIETREQLEHLENLGCNYGQGYFVSRPIAAERVGEFLNQVRVC